MSKELFRLSLLIQEKDTVIQAHVPLPTSPRVHGEQMCRNLETIRKSWEKKSLETRKMVRVGGTHPLRASFYTGTAVMQDEKLGSPQRG